MGGDEAEAQLSLVGWGGEIVGQFLEEGQMGQVEITGLGTLRNAFLAGQKS